MNIQPTNEFDRFIDSLVDELIATPDDEILGDLNPTEVQAKGLRLLQGAKSKVGRSRLAAAKAGYAALQSRPAMTPSNVSIEEARRFLVHASNDSRFTLAARNLGELSDDEVIALYTKLKFIESPKDGDAK